ncbi:MAG: FlgD immunoglobulin-like domain containing protein [bacterium]|jgi:hypothetical protein
MIRRLGLLFIVSVLAMSAMGAPAYSSENGGQLDDCIHVSVYSVKDARPGTDIFVPVVISEVTGWGILAFEMEICWCDIPAGLLQYVECAPGPVMENSGWMPPICNPCAPNCISIAAASPMPLMGNGPLFYLKFHVSANAKPCMCCDIMFEDVKLYDPEDPLNACVQNGVVCIDYCDVIGVLKHWLCFYDPCEGWYRGLGLPGARVHLWDCHGPVASEYTDNMGYFSFQCLDPLDVQAAEGGQDCYYCVGIDYCAIPRGWITAYDASLILQYLVCADGLQDCYFTLNGGGIYPQQVAADVNCTGVITAYDAALILQYIVGMLPTFPCPDMWVYYVMDPGSCTFTCPAFIEFVGILKGDVSGPPVGGGELLAVPTAYMKLGAAIPQGDYIDIPVLVEDATDVFAAEFEMTFDNERYSFVDVIPVGLGSGFFLSAREEDGHVFTAMARATSFTGSGRLAKIRLERIPGSMPGATLRPSLAAAMLNEGIPEVEIITRGTIPIAEEFRLGPVSPNPFSQGTMITFSAPGATEVAIDIYNVHGQVVRSVFSGTADAGRHEVAWDGTDSRGSRVARGVYFCRMHTGNFSATEKIVVLQ